ncbi:MAG TPA: hypothetical protein VD947_00065, partial [Patescibacteria group bacterium]|nr:hypothetical protein [Patescibacteria group bacterium]
NLGANGPLNVGNRFLRQQFLSHGYELVNLAQYIPENLDSRLATRLLEDSVNNDGHLWIAYCGKKAQDLLKLQPRIAN